MVTLRFTEPLIARLSNASVTDPNGERVDGEVSGEREIAVPLATNAPGVYLVDWTTVSPADGHTLRGEFRFGVGVDPGQGATGGTGANPRQEDLLIAVARAVEYAALLLAAGMLVVGRLARRSPPLPWVRPRLRAALAVALISGIVVVLGESFLATGTPSPGAIAAYFTSGLPGAARPVRVGLEALALGLAVGRQRAFLPVAGAVVALSAAGHAAAVSPRWWGVSADAVHLLASGVWAGGIMALATLRAPEGWRGPAGRALLDRFTPVALAAFLLTVGFGVLRGSQELTAFSDLFDTGYGRVLALKMLGVAGMVPLSILLWLRLRGTPRTEAAVAVAVVGLAALLAAYPLPPGRLAEAEADEERAVAASALPRHRDLTLGGEAGEVLLGLTLRPGEPGPNDILVHVLPLEGADAAAGIPVTLSVGRETLPMTECGPTCRRARADLEGGEQLEIQAGGKKGGMDIIELPDLPAPAGTSLFRRMEERMHDLRTYRLVEDLTSGRTTIRSTYAFQAPDRMRIEADTGFQSVFVGETRYRRERPGQRWQREERTLPAEVPSFIWDTNRSGLPRVVGTEQVEGRRTRILTFFGGSETVPIWFRLWVDPEGLVRRAEMRAQGHFMDHRYYAFDRQFVVEPPVRVGRGGPDE